jgi:hypothetical protein
MLKNHILACKYAKGGQKLMKSRNSLTKMMGFAKKTFSPK